MEAARRRPVRGVRRRRDDSVELEALDAQTMRQSSYNYFQQQQQQQQRTLPRNPLEPTFQSSLRRGAGARKRQRTLAEQLEGLSLSKERQTRFVELDEHGKERAASHSDDSEDDEASDGDHGEMLVYGGVPNTMRRFFDHTRRDRRPLDRIYRHYITLASKHHRDATDAAPAGNELVVFRKPPASLAATAPLVDGSAEGEGMTLPKYLSITPQDFQRLSTEEKRQWYQIHMQYLAQQQDHERENRRQDANSYTAEANERWRGHAGKAESKASTMTSLPSFNYRRSRSSSASSTGSFRALGVPATDEDGVSMGSGDDVEMMDEDEEVNVPKVPHLAGVLTHSEWFSDDEL